VTTQYVGEAEYCDQVAVLAHGRVVALATPQELRRSALGGEVIEIETALPFDGGLLQRVPGVRQVDQSAPRHMLLITDDAGSATPRVLQEITAAGGEVVSSSEYVPSFDEVFSKLVEREEPGEEDRHGRDRRGVARAA
jgi:ABC-2 type transport system ATP-binding protein